MLCIDYDSKNCTWHLTSRKMNRKNRINSDEWELRLNFNVAAHKRSLFPNTHCNFFLCVCTHTCKYTFQGFFVHVQIKAILSFAIKLCEQTKDVANCNKKGDWGPCLQRRMSFQKYRLAIFGHESRKWSKRMPHEVRESQLYKQWETRNNNKNNYII